MESSSPKPSLTPRPTKKPALVGPVEMPGPMPSFEPNEALPQEKGHHDRKSGGAAVAIVSIVAVLCLAAIAVVLYLGKTKKFEGKGIFKYLAPKKKRRTKYIRQNSIEGQNNTDVMKNVKSLKNDVNLINEEDK